MSDELNEYDMNLIIRGVGIFFASIIILFILCKPKVENIETTCESITIVHDTVTIIDTVCPEVVHDPMPKKAPRDQVGGSGGYVIYSMTKNKKKNSKTYKYLYYLTDSSKRGWSLSTSTSFDVDDTLDLKKR